MKGITIAVALALGAVAGWMARAPQQSAVLDGADDIIVQHPHQNQFGTGSNKTRIRLYGAGDQDFGPMPAGASNATLWVVTINGTNYRGVAQE